MVWSLITVLVMAVAAQYKQVKRVLFAFLKAIIN